MTVPFAPQPRISGIFGRMESAPRFADFPSLCSCPESSLTNLIGSGLNLLCLQIHSRLECRWTWPELEVAILGADQKERGFWGREWYQGSKSNTHDAMLSKTLVRHLEMKSKIANLTLWLYCSCYFCHQNKLNYLINKTTKAPTPNRGSDDSGSSSSHDQSSSSKMYESENLYGHGWKTFHGSRSTLKQTECFVNFVRILGL